jgi:hypothetical protein
MKKVLVTLLMLFLILQASTNFNFCKANPYGPAHVTPIYIKSDGTVDPPNSPIKSNGGNQYILTDNISPPPNYNLFNRSMYSVVIEKDNIVLDGLNHNITGLDSSGIVINYRNNVTVTNLAISHFDTGIGVYCSSNVNVTSCSIKNNEYSFELTNCSKLFIAENDLGNNYNSQPTIRMEFCTYSTIYKNNLSAGNNELYGSSAFRIDCCSNNLIIANNINNYLDGIVFLNSSNNQFNENNLICNRTQAKDLFNLPSYQHMNDEYWRFIELNKTKLAESHAKLFHTPLYASINTWKNNYWSDYNGSGSYFIDENNVDHYPLSQPVDINQAVDIKAIALTPKATASSDANPFTLNIMNAVLIAIAIIAILLIGSLLLYYRRHRKQEKKV